MDDDGGEHADLRSVKSVLARPLMTWSWKSWIGAIAKIIRASAGRNVLQNLPAERRGSEESPDVERRHAGGN